MRRTKAASADAIERFFQFALLGLVATGFLAVAGAGFLDRPTILLTAAGLILRGLLIAGVLRFQIPVILVNLATLAYMLFFAVDHFFLSRGLMEATVHLVCFLAVMKIVTARSNRDYLYTAAIALMELVAAAMLSTGINFFAFLAIYVVCAIAAFTSAEIRRSLQKSAHVARAERVRFAPRLAMLTGLATVGILALTAGLFIMLPRTANAAFRHLGSTRYHLTGFGNEVNLGQVGQIATDSRAVMHVRPFSDRMPSNLKWRGEALSHFDGKRWSNQLFEAHSLAHETPIALADNWQRSRTDGQRFSYGVDLNMADSDALFVAGIPEFLNIEHVRVMRTGTGGLRVSASAADLIRYEVSSFVPTTFASRSPLPRQEALSIFDRTRYLQLPPLDPRIPELARAVGGEGAPAETAGAIEKHLRTKYSYTLDLPRTAPADPLANFLFERQKGHCEYFASAMTVMLRSVGIPARLVNGFQSGAFNPISGLYVVRGSDAHSWVEAFLPGTGWTIFDPTPPSSRPGGAGFSQRMALLFDAADTFWQQWVVNYDLSRQITLAQRLEENTRRVRWDLLPKLRGWRARLDSGIPRFSPVWFGVLALCAVCLLFGPMVWRYLAGWRRIQKIRAGRVSPADATVLYERMLHLLKKQGYQKPPWFTPAEFAATLPASAAASLVTEFTHGYQALRFGGEREAAERMGVLLSQMESL